MSSAGPNDPPRFHIDHEDEVDTTASHKSPIDREVIDVDAKPKPKRDIALMIEAQKKYAERALKRPVAAGASSIFGGPVGSSDPFAADALSFRPGPDPDVQAAGQFEKLKEEYRRKVLLGQNSFADDVMWGKAKAAEKNRIKHIEEGVSISRSVDISSDEGLFISRGTISRKRACVEIIGDSNQAAGNSRDKEVIDILGCEGETANRMKKAYSKRQATKAYKRDLESSRLAGIEKYLIKEKRKERKQSRKSRPSKEGGKTKDAQRKSIKGKSIPKGRPLRPTQQGYLLNADSIRSSNVFDEANNNLGAAPAPDVDEARKDLALKALLIDIPLEDLKQARSEKQHILNSTKVLGKHGRCYYSNDGTGKWALKGLSSTLFHYQVQGAAWMKLRETGDVAPFGGILADQMGLGKTVQTLACMVSNQPEPGSTEKATLIVCTASLIHQWEQEIKKHVQPGVFPIVSRQGTGQRIGGSQGAHLLLEQANIVVTSYDEVRKSYPRFKPPKNIVLPETSRAWWNENFEGMCGVLHRVRWFRVVLDEAQAIKDRDSQTSIACRGLIAKYRWAVGATPIQNYVGELYAYFNFLRVPHTGNYDTFRDTICNPKDPRCGPRLHALLRQFMIRRTHADTVMGRPLIVLPQNNQRTVEVELNPVERAIYDIVQRRFIQAINECGKDGALDKRYRSALHMLLRLRQMTGHPFMLQDIIEKLFRIEDIEQLLSMTLREDSAQDDPSRDMLDAMKRMIRVKTGNASPDIVSDTTLSEVNAEDDFYSQAETSEPLVFNFRLYLQRLVQGENWTEVKARSLCHKCGDVPEVPQLEPPLSSSQVTGATALAPSIIAPRRDTEKETLRWINYGGKVLPSTKTAAVQAQIEEWQRVDPHKKIIIFSQFHTLMAVLAKLFDQKAWRYVKFNGRMNQAEREKAITDFQDEPECNIMIASLKAGGVGLNLTMASKVICVDLWWNSSVEQQAFCRVFRIGQENETFITRIVAKNTVDDKLQQMQEAKAKAIGQAIDDDTMLRALTLRELMGLFGEVAVD
ncbi:MAG: hypothetical protein Q9223_005095, partial [Gallowayella weberi]